MCLDQKIDLLFLNNKENTKEIQLPECFEPQTNPKLPLRQDSKWNIMDRLGG